MPSKFSLVIALAFFIFLPSVLIGRDFGFTLGFGFFCLCSFLFAIYLCQLDLIANQRAHLGPKD